MTSDQEFFEFILDHYERPRNRGTLEGADVVMKGGNPTCGDIVTLYLELDGREGTIRAIRFTGEGCTISQAAASLTTEVVVGQSVAEARALRADRLLEALGPSVLRSRRRCATLALHTLRAALSHYHAEPPAPAERGLHFESQSDEGGQDE